MFSAETETENSLPQGVVLAQIRARFWAAILDELIVVVPAFIVVFIWALTTNDTKIGDGEYLLIAAVVAVVSATYHTVCVAVWGRTVGKLVTHVRVVRVDTGGPTGWWYAGIRALVPTALGTIPAVGPYLVFPVYIMAFFDPRRQGVHDKAAGTIVVTDIKPTPSAL